MGPVLASGDPLPPPSAEVIISDCVCVVWFVTMNTTGPAPTVAGETETRELLMYTVRLTGEGGRGWLAAEPPVDPQPASNARTVALAA